jgi:dethiobiotin synthetase
MTAYFITGTGTDVGKTHVAAAILRAAAERGLVVDATKPVMSGVDPLELAESDAGRLLAATGRQPTDEAVRTAAPWRFAAPLSPAAAARAEGRKISYDDVLAFCRARLALAAHLHVVEAAGGVMSPIAEGALSIDLARDLGLPVVLVAGAYLGAVSHTLTALAVLENDGIGVAAVIVNEASADAMAAEAITAELRGFSEAPLFAWRHGEDAPPGELLAALGLM